MKKYLILALIAIAALFTAQVLVGKHTENYYQDLVRHIEESGFQVVSHQYERDWFTAVAETKFRWARGDDLSGVDSPLPADFGFLLSSEISHGPLTAAGAGLADISSSLRPEPAGLLSGADAGEMQTFVSLDGKGHTTLRWSPGEHAVESSAAAMTFGGLSGEIRFDPSAMTADWKLNSPGLTVSGGEQVRIALVEFDLDSSSRVGSSGLTLGNGKFTLGELQVVDGNSGESIRALQLGLRVESSEQGQRVSGSAGYSLEQLQVGGQVYGPGHLRLELTNLFAPGLLRIQKAVREIRRHPMSEAQRGMAVMNTLMGVAPELLANDPGIAIDVLRLTTPEGVIEGHLSLRSDGLRWEQISLGFKALDKLTGDLAFRMPEPVFMSLLEAWLAQQIGAGEKDDDGKGALRSPEQLQVLIEEQSRATLEGLLRQQFLVREDGHIATAAALSGGLVTVNGKTFPLLR